MQAEHYLQEARDRFRKMKEQADRAVGQVAERDFFATLDPESNSIAHIIKHLAGNIRSRWSDLLTSDGEKADRNRDSEFVIDKGDTRASLQDRWERSWSCLFETLTQLVPSDIEKTVLIRGEPHSVIQAINRQLTHVAYHVGQVVFLAKHFKADKWQTLSIPRGQSEQFTAAMQKRMKE